MLFYGNLVGGPQERVIGFLRVSLSTDSIASGFSSIVLKGTIITILFLAVGALLSFQLAHRLTVPISRLNDGVKSIGAGKLGEKVDVATSDEIGDLARAFNEMSMLLDAREKEKLRLTEQLEHSKRLEALGTFAGGISHDFNNILSIIQHNMDLARMKSPAYIEDYITRSLEATKRGSSLVSQLMDFTTGSPQYDMAVNFGLLVQDTIRLFDAPNAPYRIQLNVQQGLWMVIGDTGQLHRVLVNLLSNARDAINEVADEVRLPGTGKHFIHIELSNVSMKERPVPGSAETEHREYVQMVITDNGCGMDRNVQERIFEPFFSTKKPGGTGLGLSTVYGIIKHHNGRIEVQSEPGRGTTFRILLPRSTQDIAIPVESEKETGEIIGGTETILLVDDEKTLLEAMEENLEDLGYTVHLAYNGKEALKLLRDEDNIDLVIMDHIMPEMTGIEVIQRMRELGISHEVILYSGTNLQQYTSLLEGVHYVSKPFNLADMSRKIRSILGSEQSVTMKSHFTRVGLHVTKEAAPPHLGNISDTFSAYRLFRHIVNDPREVFLALFLDSQNNLIAYENLSTGTTNQATVYPKEVVRLALMTNATGVLLIHNHPSGDHEPSEDDIVLTAAIVQACKVMDIVVKDHLIITEGSFTSLVADGYMSRNGIPVNDLDDDDDDDDDEADEDMDIYEDEDEDEDED